MANRQERLFRIYNKLLCFNDVLGYMGNNDMPEDELVQRLEQHLPKAEKWIGREFAYAKESYRERMQTVAEARCLLDSV